MKKLLMTAASALLLVGAASSAAIAGEIKGPPGTMDSTNVTGALDHAQSACAASGLNDLDSEEGQSESQVQTAADSWKYYGLPKGAPGTLGLCQGGPPA
jgi:opacity protein-like surface antigen